MQLLAELTGGLSGLRVAVLGAAYRGGVKETAFSGVFAIVRELALRGCGSRWCTTRSTAESELRGLGLVPYHLGEPCDAVIIHTDHSEYAVLTPEDLPGVRALVDGRAVTDPARWGAVPRRVLGIGAATAAPRQARTSR